MKTGRLSIGKVQELLVAAHTDDETLTKSALDEGLTWVTMAKIEVREPTWSSLKIERLLWQVALGVWDGRFCSQCERCAAPG
jgi:hypothetical protein